jgi:hypothetical protein
LLLGFAGLTTLLVLVGLVWFRAAIYHHYVTFPAEKAAWEELRGELQPLAQTHGWNEYLGIVHSHSHLSHDCEVPFEEILAVLQQTGRDFICLSDHWHEGKADFSAQWRGLHSGKLFIPGYEMKEGLMGFGVASGVVLSNRVDGSTLARQIVSQGGVIFYSHPEEPRDWDRPEVSGMELYNTHADFKDGRLSLAALIPELCLNLGPYPEQVVRLIFDPPVENLRRWDAVNRQRPFAGIGGNDCHQNTGFRGFVTPEGKLRVEDTSPKTIGEYRLNFLTRWLLRAAFGPLDPGRRLFHVQLDPYPRMARYVTTHVLAKELNETNILSALKQGRSFVAFDLIAESKGFSWLAKGPDGQAAMGEAMALAPGVELHAAAPLPCRFTVIKDGETVHQQEGRTMSYAPGKPGKYRVEAELRIRGRWVPWVYANPIWLKEPAAK